MQAGYQYNKGAQAKAQKAAVKNSKKDKVLYGAVIKSEAALLSTTPQGTTVPSNGSASTTAKEFNERQLMGSNDPMLLKKQQVRDLALADLIRSEDSISNIGSPKSVVSAPPILMNITKELKSKLSQANLGLKPVDSRKSNVKVASDASSLGSHDSSKASATPVTNVEMTSTQQVPVNTDTATIGTTTDQALDDLEEKAPPPKEPQPKDLIRVDRMDTNLQEKAEELFNLLQAKRKEMDKDSTKSERFTAYDYKDAAVPDTRIAMKINKPKSGDWFSFVRVFNGKEDATIYQSPDVDYGIDLLKSIAIAKKRVDEGIYRPNSNIGETNGLGISDPDHIGSKRVMYKSNKGTHGVPKGVLYLMEPQLIRGHIRLYNKSGRPVVSRSSVSPYFQRIAKDIVERNTFEADDYAGIDSKEAADVNKFIEATKPIQPRNINRLNNADTIWQLKKRYEVLVGELSAGNQGKLVTSEMESILRDLIRMHALNADKGRELIRSLREF